MTYEDPAMIMHLINKEAAVDKGANFQYFEDNTYTATFYQKPDTFMPYSFNGY